MPRGPLSQVSRAASPEQLGTPLLIDHAAAEPAEQPDLESHSRAAATGSPPSSEAQKPPLTLQRLLLRSGAVLNKRSVKWPLLVVFLVWPTVAWSLMTVMSLRGDNAGTISFCIDRPKLIGASLLEQLEVSCGSQQCCDRNRTKITSALEKLDPTIFPFSHEIHKYIISHDRTYPAHAAAWAGMLAISWAIAGALYNVCDILQPTGVLYTLGKLPSGFVTLSEEARSSLNRWVAAGCTLMGTGAVVAIYVVFYEVHQCSCVYKNGALDHDGMCSAYLGLPAMAFGAAQCLAALWWYLSLLVGASLANAKVKTVVAVTRCSADDTVAEWNHMWAKVQSSSVLLARETLPALSTWGFGTGVLFFGGFCLMLGLIPSAADAYEQAGDALDILDNAGPQAAHLEVDFSLIIVGASLPILIASVPAGVTSQCNKLLSALNELRPECNPEQKQRVLELEQYLMRTNGGQGMGFVVAGIVVNMRTLKKIAMAVYVVLLPMATYMSSMRSISETTVQS